MDIYELCSALQAVFDHAVAQGNADSAAIIYEHIERLLMGMTAEPLLVGKVL